MRHATPPAASGVANEVPLPEVAPLLYPIAVPVPRALASGFITPTELGPYEEKVELSPVELTPPMVKTFSLSAGVMIYFQGSWASFPAAASTKIPFSTAICAALAIKEVVPFMSE